MKVATRLEIHPSLDELAHVRRWARALPAALEERDADALELALTEALSNVIRHAYRERPPHPIRLQARITPGRLTLEILHRGEDFDPCLARPPAFDGSRESGFGLFLIEQSLDRVSYSTLPDGTQRIRMEKDFGGHRQKGEPEMQITMEQTGVQIVLLSSDYLDASNAKDFRKEIAPVLESGTQVVFDMSKVQFVDSSGLGAILSCLRQLNAKGGDLKLCAVTRPVRALLELVRMHKVMDIYNNREEALAAFRG